MSEGAANVQGLESGFFLCGNGASSLQPTFVRMKPNSIASDIEALDPADDAALAEDTFESIGKFFERALIGTAMMKMS